MAQKQQQYESVLDSIFDFIFKGARKNVKASPPRTVPGISGNEMAYALGEIALRPGIYANEEVLTPLNEVLDNVALAESQTKLDKENKLKTGFSAKNMSDFFVDPEGFVEAQFKRAQENQKAARKLNFIRGFGGIMDLGIAATVAKSAGASSIGSLETASILGNEYMAQEARDLKAEELAALASGYDTGTSRGLNFDHTSKLAKTFASVLNSTQPERAVGLGEPEIRREIKKKMARFGFTNLGEIDELYTNYLKREKYYGDKGIKVKDGEWNLGGMDRNIPKKEGINYSGGPDEWLKSKDASNRLKAMYHDKTTSLINYLTASGASPTDPRLVQAKKELAQLNIWVAANGKNMKMSKYMGEAYLNIQAFNSLVLQGEGLTSVLSGDFFDPRKNALSPSRKNEAKISSFDDKYKFDDIVIPRDNMNSIYGSLTGLYYFTPGSIARTLFINGEGFVYRAYCKQEKMKEIIKGSDSLYDYVESYTGPEFAALLPGMTLTGNRDAVLSALAAEDKYVELIKILDSNRATVLSDADLAKVFNELEKLHKQLENSVLLKYSKALQEFMAKYSPKALVNKAITGALIGVLGKNVGGKIAGVLVQGNVALKSLARQGARAFLHFLTQTLGFVVSGGLANIILYAATEVIYFVGQKLLKPVIKLGYAVIWVLGLLFLSTLISILNFLSPIYMFYDSVKGTFDTAGNTAPIFCEQCGGSPISGSETSDDSDTSDVVSGAPADSGPVSPPPEMADVTCPLGDASLNCSQRPYGSYSHSGVNAIDIKGPPPTYWSAPSDGVITKVEHLAYENPKIPGQKCGGVVHFYSPEHKVTHVLLHVVSDMQRGDEVSAGTPIAKIALESDGNINFISHNDDSCATGPHFHLEVRGSSVYADRYYKDFLNCNLGTCSR